MGKIGKTIIIDFMTKQAEEEPYEAFIHYADPSLNLNQHVSKLTNLLSGKAGVKTVESFEQGVLVKAKSKDKRKGFKIAVITVVTKAFPKSNIYSRR